MLAIVTLSVVLLTVLVGAIVWNLDAICMHSQSFLSISPTDLRRPSGQTKAVNAERAGHDERVRPRCRSSRSADPAPQLVSRPLRACTHLGVRYRDRTCGVLLFGEPDALAGVVSGARDPADLGQSAHGRGAGELRGVRHDIWHTDIRELVFGFTACACGNRRCRAAARRNGEHCDHWSSRDRDSESPRKDQSSSWKVEGRHRHAFSSLLAVSSRKRSVAVSDLTAVVRFPAYA
jgi:hypothetical protein